jgi:hypothetical protein
MTGMARFLLLYKSIMKTNLKQPPRAPSRSIQPPPFFNGKGLFPQKLILFPVLSFFYIGISGVLNARNHLMIISAKIGLSTCYDRTTELSENAGHLKEENI